jgi:hypothetical protein
MSEAGGGEDGGDEQGCFVADSAGGVLVDGEGVERSGVGNLSGEAHRLGECGQLPCVEAAEEDGHEERGDLGVGDELLCWGAIDDGEDEGADLGVSEGEAVAFVQNYVDGMDGVGHVLDRMFLYELVRRNAAGSKAAMVDSAVAPFSAGK